MHNERYIPSSVEREKDFFQIGVKRVVDSSGRAYLQGDVRFAEGVSQDDRGRVSQALLDLIQEKGADYVPGTDERDALSHFSVYSGVGGEHGLVQLAQCLTMEEIGRRAQFLKKMEQLMNDDSVREQKTRQYLLKRNVYLAEFYNYLSQTTGAPPAFDFQWIQAELSSAFLIITTCNDPRADSYREWFGRDLVEALEGALFVKGVGDKTHSGPGSIFDEVTVQIYRPERREDLPAIFAAARVQLNALLTKRFERNRSGKRQFLNQVATLASPPVIKAL